MDQEKQSKSRFSTTFAEVSAGVALAAICIYVVGLWALWLPISRTFTNDFSTAWYAVSLVPQTVIAGQGVRQVLIQPALALFLIMCFYVFAAVLRGRFRLHNITIALVLALVFAVPIMGWMIWIIVTGEKTKEPFAPSNLVEAGISTLAFVISIVGGLASGTMLNRGLQFAEGNYLPKVVSVSNIVRGVTVSCVAVIIAAFLNSAVREPPLPTVKFSKSSIAEGALLTHSEGFWYVFDSKGQLQAIPDDKAGSVLLVPEDDED